MGEYKAKKRDDKPSRNRPTANTIKEKGGSKILQAAGIPKPIADLLSKKAVKNNKRLPGMPKVPGSHSRNNKPKESEKQNESTKKQDNDKNNNTEGTKENGALKHINHDKTSLRDPQGEANIKFSFQIKVIITTVLGVLASIFILYIITIQSLTIISNLSKYSDENNAHTISVVAGETSDFGTTSSNLGPTNGKQGTYYAPVQNVSTGFGGIGSTPNCSNSVSHDLSLKEGVEIYAGMDGTAEFIQKSCNGVLYSYGNQVKVKSSDGTYIIYAHLKSFVGGTSTPITNTCSKKGNTPPCPSTSCKGGVTSKTIATKTVKKGELIGYTGNTGNSTKPHLHVEIHEKGSSSCVTDPWKAFGMR